ncbi:MAG: hypothetical protein KC416_16805, partial [Myxococcales bacterium]|nr:hypothetical protein [Myxococcales bacterium]
MKLIGIGCAGLLALAACDVTDALDDLTEDTSTSSTSKMITAADGGKVELEGATLDIPAGALEADTEITVATKTTKSLPDSDNVASKGYDFGPDGLTFLKPVTLTIPATIPGDKTAVMAFLDGTTWTELGDSATADGKVTATTTHFTTFAVIFTAGGGQVGGMCDGDIDDCGGDPVGTWKITSGCADFPEANPFGDDQCPGASLTGAFDFDGTVTFKADKSYSLDVAVDVTVTISAPKSCFPGEACPTMEEEDDPDFKEMGDKCVSEDVQEAEEQDPETGTYTVDGGTLTLMDDDESILAFCVKGNTMTVQSKPDAMSDDPAIQMTLTK